MTVKNSHRASYFWGNSNKNDNINNNNNARTPPFNGECNNCGKIGHMAVGYWAKKGK